MPESFERNKQFARRLSVLQLLSNSRYGMSPSELKDAVIQKSGYEIGDRSIERDIKFLQECGYPVVVVKTGDPQRSKVWKLERIPGIKLFTPDEPVSVVELMALAAARDLLYPLAGTPLWQGIQSLWSKFRAGIDDAIWSHYDKERPNLYVARAPRKDYTDQEGQLSTLNRGVFQNRLVKVLYQSLRDEKPRERLIAPHCLFFDGRNSFFVVAVDTKDKSETLKTYKLDRFSKADITDTRFKPRDDIDLDEMYSDSIGVFRSDEIHRFRIRADKSVAQWITETPLHIERTLEPQKDGSVIVEFQGHFDEIMPHILGLGQHVEVLEPLEARQRVVEIAEQLMKSHATPTGKSGKKK
ncbi:MAG: WYL domain-containing transcriptional regulator [Planctomycetaceae bacterium]